MLLPILFVGGDARSAHAAEYLRKKGAEVHAHALAGLPDEPLPEKISALALPFPSLRAGVLRGDAPLPVENLLKRLAPGAVVFGGGLSGLPKGNFKAIDLLGSEPMTTKNAALTAEAALLLAMQTRAAPLCEARCLVVGFGRCGKLLAEKLRALGAEVTVAARNPADLALLGALGFDAVALSRICCAGSACVLNTVPAQILNGACFTGFSGHYFELASAPGGLTPEAKAALGSRFIDAGALPARFFPAAAGALYGAAIWESIREELP